MDFIVIDVETANPDLASICQIGVAVFANGSFRESWNSLVNPDDYFDSYNISIHGITERMVESAPRWIEVHDRLRAAYSSQILASHTPFDRTAIRRACEKASATPFECSLALRSSASLSSSVAQNANPNGILFGNVVVFTGALSMPRQEAASAAALAGCEVATSVTKHTTLLVVGDQDIRRLAGADKSTKHRKAEELMAKGQKIRVLGESDFISLIGA